MALCAERSTKEHLMKRLLLILPMLLAATAASADMESYSASMPRLDISNMSCDQVQSELRSQGKAILRRYSKTGLPRYGKYVAWDTACKNQQFWFRASVRTTDTKSPDACQVMQCNTYGKPANH
jgi:hypothetical protein